MNPGAHNTLEGGVAHKGYAWAVKWRQKGGIDGDRSYLMGSFNIGAMLFQTRSEARQYIKENWSYIRDRKDLRTYPHGWRMPVPVKVSIDIQELSDVGR
jgi:hypothetical protein